MIAKESAVEMMVLPSSEQPMVCELVAPTAVASIGVQLLAGIEPAPVSGAGLAEVSVIQLAASSGKEIHAAESVVELAVLVRVEIAVVVPPVGVVSLVVVFALEGGTEYFGAATEAVLDNL